MKSRQIVASKDIPCPALDSGAFDTLLERTHFAVCCPELFALNADESIFKFVNEKGDKDAA